MVIVNAVEVTGVLVIEPLLLTVTVPVKLPLRMASVADESRVHSSRFSMAGHRCEFSARTRERERGWERNNASNCGTIVSPPK
jgi:hypothetical protein